jgi:hypothetical protein
MFTLDIRKSVRVHAARCGGGASCAQVWVRHERCRRDATHIVLYKKKETGVKSLDGRVACKLGPDNYGRCEWWLLLQPVESE